MEKRGFAIFKRKGGTLGVLPITDFTNSGLLKVSKEFRSFGNEVEAYRTVGQQAGDGGVNA